MIASRTAPVKMNVARFVVAVLVVAVILPATADGARGVRRHIRMRMDGYVGPPPQGRNEMASLQLRAGRTNVPFQVTAATVLSGSTLAANVFSQVRPYRPNFILRGPPDLVGQIENAAPGAKLRIIGNWVGGTRDFMVASVERRDDASGAH
jgi:hypothetical protein